MKRFIAGFPMALLVAALASPGCARAPEAVPSAARQSAESNRGVVTLNILSTNDIHGALMPTLMSELASSPASSPGSAPGSAQTSGSTPGPAPVPASGGKLGGVEYLAGMIGKIRSSTPGNTVLVDAGDCSQGDYAVNASEGLFCTDFFNTVGYDIRTIGNHEFDYLDVGPDINVADPRGALKRAAGGAGQPIVLANAHLADGSPIVATFLEYRILDIAGVKVGFTGLITPLTPTVSRRLGSQGVVFEQPVDALRRVLPRMRADGATVIVVLTHLTGLCEGRTDLPSPDSVAPCTLDGELSAIEKAFSNDDIDLIVSGHDHVMLRGDGPTIPVLENMGQGITVGRAAIDVDRLTGRRVGAVRVLPHVPVCLAEARGSAVCDPAWPGFMGVAPADPAVAALRSRTEALVAAECADVVATASSDILFFRGTEPPLGNLAVDLLRELGSVRSADGVVTPADFAFMNRGSTRGSLAAGPITVCDIARVWPFTDPPVVVSLTGAEIERMMYFLIDDVKKAPVISGMTVSREGQGPLAIKDLSGTPLDPGRTYRVVTTKYLVEGGDRMDEFFRQVPADRVAPLPFASYRDGFVSLLRARGVISAPDTTRYTGVVRE